jgi:hypothetical protein
MTSLSWVVACKSEGLPSHVISDFFLRLSVILCELSKYPHMVDGKFYAVLETLLHPDKIGVWREVSHRRFIGPTFFENTINYDRYTDIVHEFLGRLTEEEIPEAWFKEGRATFRAAPTTMSELSMLFGD